MLTSSGVDVYLAKIDAAGTHLWSKRFGDAADQESADLAINPAGDIAVTGAFVGSIDFGGGALTSAGQEDIFLAKLDGSGNHEWSQRFGSPGTQVGRELAYDPTGNLVLAGFFAGTVNLGGSTFGHSFGSSYMGKFSLAGSHIWSKAFTAVDSPSIAGLGIDGGSNVVITGRVAGPFDFGGGVLTPSGTSQSDVYVARFASNGAHSWSKLYGDAESQFPHGLTVESNGRLSLMGSFEGTIDFGGGPLTYGGGIYINNNDIFLATLDPADVDLDGVEDGLDNCPTDDNLDQFNNDRNFIDNSPPYSMAVDDGTRAMSDVPGDACDPDDDNDGIIDSQEIYNPCEGQPEPCVPSPCYGSGTYPHIGDTDGDRFLDGVECALGASPATSSSRPPIAACGPTGDSDGDKVSDRFEYCYYATDTDNTDSDGDGTKDGCEAASFNGDRIVNVADMGMLAVAISNAAFRIANVDVNKDGVWNPADQGLVASFISPSGQCP